MHLERRATLRGQTNRGAWKAVSPRYGVTGACRVCPVPISNKQAGMQDIQVLMYGTTGQLVFHQLFLRGVTAVSVSGLFDAGRDELIARSRTARLPNEAVVHV